MEISSTSGFFNEIGHKNAVQATPELRQNISQNHSEHEANLFTEAIRVAQHAPDLREDKVARLRAQVAAGTYDFDVKAIAKALIRDDLNLF